MPPVANAEDQPDGEGCDRSGSAPDVVIGHNLTAQTSSFVGRTAELSEVDALLAAHRLVTLTGLGGCGKTRLAAESTQRLINDPEIALRFPDGIWWMDLGALTDPEHVAQACADVLMVRLEPSGDAVATLTSRLATKRLLLCLDTCEHVLETVSSLVSDLLRACPQIRILATSREPLDVPGEAIWRVPTLQDTEAVRLFADRAALVAPEVGTAGPDDHVRQICARVDCLPLAIELAAAWMRVLSPTQLLAGLDDHFRLLSGGSSRSAPRHQALGASMAWSHDLLQASERMVFRRLAVFVGGFDLGGAVAVAGHGEVLPEDVLSILARLVDKSFVVTQRADDQIRYRLLDTVRQYAGDQLDTAGEVDETRGRHLDWCLRSVAAIEAGLDMDQDRWRVPFERIEENVTSALRWGLLGDAGQVQRSQELAATAAMPWFLHGHASQGLAFVHRALAVPGDSTALTERLRGAAALLDIISGGYPSTPGLETGPGDVVDPIARAQLLLRETYRSFFVDFEACDAAGRAAAETAERAGYAFGRDFATIMVAYSLTAREKHEEAIEVARLPLERSRKRNDRFCIAFALGIEQYAAMQTGDLAGSVRLGHTMVEVIAPLGDYFGVGTLTSNLALAMVLSGDLTGARRLMRPIVASLDSAPDVDVVGFQIPMGQASLQAGEWDDAIGWFARGLRRLDDLGTDWIAGRCLAGTVLALRRLGRRTDAQALLERGKDLSSRFGAPQFAADLAEQEAFLARDVDLGRSVDLHHRALDIRREAGLGTFIPDSLDALVALSADLRPTLTAVRVLAASDRARAEMGRTRPLGEAQDYDDTVQRLRDATGDDFDSAYSRGWSLSLDEAVDLLRRGRGSRDRPTVGWDSLTPMEREVVQLVMAGSSNASIGEKLFISRSTVKSHLSHVFAKVGVTNRTELAAIAAERPTDPNLRADGSAPP